MRTRYAPSFIQVVGETGRGRLARSACTSKGRQEMLPALRATSQRRWGACVAPRSVAPRGNADSIGAAPGRLPG